MTKQNNAPRVDQIGMVAGLVWRHLEENGESSLTQLRKSVKVGKLGAELGIGWLAREGKIELEEKGRVTVARLAAE